MFLENRILEHTNINSEGDDLLASFPGFSFSYYVCWNMKNKLQKHGEKENTYTHA